MDERVISLLERVVIVFEKLAGSSSTEVTPAPAPKTRRKAADTAAAAATAETAAATAETASAAAPSKADEVKASTVTKEQVRQLLQVYGDLDNIANALKITAKFATAAVNSKGQPCTGTSIGTIDPEQYENAFNALSEAIAAKQGTKTKAADPLDD